MLAAEGKRSSRASSTAVARSGLMSRSMPMSRLKALTSTVYSTLRTRATVKLVPRCLALRQQTILTSSMLVAAMSTSACSAPASLRTLMEAPLPLTHMTSKASSAFRRASLSLSTMVMLWSSWESSSASV